MARVTVSRDVQRNDQMILRIEGRSPGADTAAIAETLLSVTRLRGIVEQVPAGSLVQGGLLVTDARKYD